jgi:hypothetical protein
MGICVFFSFWVLAYSVAALLNSTGQMIFFLALAVIVVLANAYPYKYRFPGMEHYTDGQRIDARSVDPSGGPAGDRVELLGEQEALRAWKGRTGQARPKLILVAVTGGAYRAAFWTTVVLDELSRRLDDFPKHVRLITGASGGMVGAAYFAALREEDGRAVEATEVLRRESGRDSLTPIARQLIRRDLPMALWPFPQRRDRGIVLEEQWKALDRTFACLYEGEKRGWRPSLIISPMVVETGRRLLISNLDLSDLVVTQARALPGSPGGGPKLYGRSAVQFFRVFPKAYDTLKVQTAVRMSATFPYASPAVSLPTIPPRRVVDAGYYDNYGVDLAAAWAYANAETIRTETSGVALVEIRAYPNESDRLAEFAFSSETAPDAAAGFVDWLRTSVQGITSPLEGGLSARVWGMQFHNAAVVRVLADIFNTAAEPHFFETFVFENFSDFAMDWFVTEQDIDNMKRSMGVEGFPAVPSQTAPGAAGVRPAGWAASGARERVLEESRSRTAKSNEREKDRLIEWMRPTDGVDRQVVGR